MLPDSKSPLPLPSLPWKTYDRVLCIPSYDEFEYLPQVLEDVVRLPHRPLVMIHNNCRVNSPKAVLENNQKLHQWLLSFPHISDGHCHLIEYNGIDLLLMDYSHPPRLFSETEGVGLARHELGELACLLIEKNVITEPWMWCTDGDVRLPQNYLDLPNQQHGVELMGYVHAPAPLELSLYEIGLRYYTLGLQWADSPVAFPTIGSCIVIHATTFKKIYGFPKRQAAEDFYLLNKAVKVAPVHYSNTKTLTIRGRPSDRVPFGTGQGMNSIAKANLQHFLYHPQIFVLLKVWITVLRTASDDALVAELSKIVPDYPYFKKLHKVMRQKCPESQRIRRRFVFFDCFQTMRWVHHLRDTHWSSLPIKEALNDAPFIDIPCDVERPSLINQSEWFDLQDAIFQYERNCRATTFQL
jgi:hypothetical protein